MRLNRLLKYINVLIGVLIAALVAIVYWFAIRPLPKTSGSVDAPIAQAGSVTRDSMGVPHIRAASVEDTLFLQGYVTAQDRLWQMDILRRAASGEISEVVGPATLEMDREARRLRIRRLAEEHARTLPPQDRAYIAAYARGVNHFIITHLDKLPVEFTVLQYDPRPWTVTDTLCIGLQMIRDLTNSWKDEIAKAGMMSAGEKDLVSQIFPVRSGQEVAPGSNAWALSGKRTASGKPILANDPHLRYTFPSTWYIAHLQGPELNVEGVTLPGLPGVVIGHNDRIAWGITNLGFDVQDLYLEQLDFNTGRYLYGGRVEQARPERELIPVKGQRPQEHTTWVTRHGPIFHIEGQHAFALRWIAAEPESFQFPFLQLNMARNWDEFRSALRRLPAPSSNLVYADVDGNIGYQAVGLLPIRRTYDGDVPTAGATGATEWQGFIPFDELPSVLNPPSGAIVSANQNPFPADYPYRVNGQFGPYYRSRQILNLLGDRTGFKPEDMLAIQKDVYSALMRFLALQAVQVHDKRRPDTASLEAAAAILREWDGQMDKDQPAALLAALLYQHLKRAVGDRASNGKGQLWEATMAGPVLERILRERPAEWFTDYDQLVMRALVDAVDEGKRLQGRNLQNWKYGQYLETSMNNPVLGQARWVKHVPAMGRLFRINVGPVPMSGGSTTVKQTTRLVGPSMRFVADTSDWDRSLLNLPLGQSGMVLSWHYSDQWENYYYGRSKTIPFRQYEGSTLEFKPAGGQ